MQSGFRLPYEVSVDICSNVNSVPLHLFVLIDAKFQSYSKCHYRITELTNKQTTRSRALSEKLTGPQLTKNFPAFYGTRRLITEFTSTRHLSLL